MVCNVLITCAAGSTGSEAVKASVARGLRVRAMVHRRDARSTLLEDLGVDVVVGDLLDLDSVVSAMRGIDAVYFVYPIAPGALNAAVNIVQAANETKEPAIVYLSDRSANRASESLLSREAWLSEQVLDWSGLHVVHLRPTYFLDWLLYPWQLPLIAEQGILRLPAGRGRHAPVATGDIGRVVAAILEKPGDHIGKTYPLSGPVELDHEQMATELSQALGTTIRFEDVSSEEYQQGLNAMGVPLYIADHLRVSMQAYKRGAMSGRNDLVERITGHKATGVGEFARRNADLLSPQGGYRKTERQIAF